MAWGGATETTAAMLYGEAPGVQEPTLVLQQKKVEVLEISSTYRISSKNLVPL